MALTVNNAGALQTDPVLSGIGVIYIAGCPSINVTAVNDAFFDTSSGFPGSTTVKSSLSPVATIITSGSSGTYTNATGDFTIGDTTGLAAFDAIYISHPSITDGVYLVDTVVDGSNVRLQSDPFSGSDRSGIFFQVAWSYASVFATGNQSGDQQHFKFDATNGVNNTQVEDFVWHAAPPNGADYIEIESGDYTGQSVNDPALSLDILRNWPNRGGIITVELTDHGTQSVNNFTWTSGGGAGEVPIATALSGITADAGDGAKYGRLILRARQGANNFRTVDFDLIVDTAGPVLNLSAIGSF